MSDDKPPRKRRPTPAKPPLKGRLVEPPAPPAPRPRRDPARVSGLRSSVYCPECVTELLHDPSAFGLLACPGCGLTYWQRGAQLVPEGSTDAVDTPSTTLPRAQARIRKKDEP
jgi:hypothetical protein